MKKQNKLSIKVLDLEPLKDVTGGRHRFTGITDCNPGRTNTSGCGTLPLRENGITDAQPLDGQR